MMINPKVSRKYFISCLPQGYVNHSHRLFGNHFLGPQPLIMPCWHLSNQLLHSPAVLTPFHNVSTANEMNIITLRYLSFMETQRA